MTILNWPKINNLFTILCITATASLMVYCLCHYLRDEDVSSVHFTKFYSSNEAPYPSFSFCILQPFLENEFDVYGGNVNMSTYIKFLRGELWDERMLDVDYDNVTVSLKENLAYGYAFLQNETGWIWNVTHHVSFRSSERKCFTIDAPDFDKSLNWYFGVYIKNDIFPNGKWPQRKDGGGFFTYLHYPGQRFTSYYTVKNQWPLRSNKSENYEMLFIMKNIDVLTHRRKASDMCYEDWKNYDQFIMDSIMVDNKCRPPHWITDKKLPICSNVTEMAKCSLQPSTAQVDRYDPPCGVIERLDYTYQEKAEKQDIIGM